MWNLVLSDQIVERSVWNWDGEGGERLGFILEGENPNSIEKNKRLKLNYKKNTIDIISEQGRPIEIVGLEMDKENYKLSWSSIYHLLIVF